MSAELPKVTSPEVEFRHAIEDAVANYRQHADSHYIAAVMVLVDVAAELTERWELTP